MIFRVLLIGCGRIAGAFDTQSSQYHAGAIGESPHLQLVACVDDRFDRAIKIAHDHKAVAYQDLHAAVCETNPNVIVIANPSEKHFETINKCLKSASNSLRCLVVEKPICTNARDWQSLRTTLDTIDVRVLVNHNRRLSTRVNWIKKQFETGALGDLLQFRASYYGGWILNGIHSVDTFSFICDESIDWFSKRQVVAARSKGDFGFDISGIGSKSGVKVEMSYFPEEHYQVFDFDMFFTHGRLQIRNFGGDVVFEKVRVNDLSERVLIDNSSIIPREEDAGLSSLYNQVSNYLRGRKVERLADLEVGALDFTMQSLWGGLDTPF